MGTLEIVERIKALLLDAGTTPSTTCARVHAVLEVFEAVLTGDGLTLLRDEKGLRLLNAARSCASRAAVAVMEAGLPGYGAFVFWGRFAEAISRANSSRQLPACRM
jgi:hypothetical protein